MTQFKTREEATKKLLARLPKNYHDRVEYLEPSEEDLIDDCKYILAWTEKYTDGEVKGGTIPVRSVSEAVDWVKDCLWKSPR